MERFASGDPVTLLNALSFNAFLLRELAQQIVRDSVITENEDDLFNYHDQFKPRVAEIKAAIDSVLLRLEEIGYAIEDDWLDLSLEAGTGVKFHGWLNDDQVIMWKLVLNDDVLKKLDAADKSIRRTVKRLKLHRSHAAADGDVHLAPHVFEAGKAAIAQVASLAITNTAMKGFVIDVAEQLTGKVLVDPVQSPPMGKPRWDADKDTLYFDGKIVATYGKNASNCRPLLDQFELEKWTHSIKDPLPGGRDITRINETVRSLNDNLKKASNRPRIKFSAGGDGKTICWDEAPPSTSPKRKITSNSQTSPRSLP